jgi:predicted metal-binding protein
MTETSDYIRLKNLALDKGFDDAGFMDVSKLEFLQEVRDMCAADKCHNYNRSWSCPPAAPTLEAMREKVRGYSGGLLVQTVGQLEDSLDFEGMGEAGQRHKDNFDRLWDALAADYPALYPMGAGGCSKCQSCAYPDAPCRFPDKLAYSMEACGLYVSRVCTDNGMKYNHGKDTICYSSCFLLV